MLAEGVLEVIGLTVLNDAAGLYLVKLASNSPNSISLWIFAAKVDARCLPKGVSLCLVER
jgi:hypothetical protein